MPPPFDPELFDALPPQTAMVLRHALRRRRLVTVLLFALAAVIAALVVWLQPWRGALILSPTVVVLLALALLEYRALRKLQYVIHTLVEQPHRVTSALIVTHRASKRGKAQSLNIRLADNTHVRIFRMFSDEPLVSACEEIRAAIGR